jgi:hypothetical protein
LQKIIIPQYKFRGETAVLECDYQLNGKRDADDDIESTNFNYHDHQEVEVLYSVKWYKDGEEFYRFVPKSNPPQNSYKGEDGARIPES